eukprot:351807-Chlamydomonas_euryale.AAC.2
MALWHKHTVGQGHHGSVGQCGGKVACEAVNPFVPPAPRARITAACEAASRGVVPPGGRALVPASPLQAAQWSRPARPGSTWQLWRLAALQRATASDLALPSILCMERAAHGMPTAAAAGDQHNPECRVQLSGASVSRGVNALACGRPEDVMKGREMWKEAVEVHEEMAECGDGEGLCRTCTGGEGAPAACLLGREGGGGGTHSMLAERGRGGNRIRSMLAGAGRGGITALAGCLLERREVAGSKALSAASTEVFVRRRHCGAAHHCSSCLFSNSSSSFSTPSASTLEVEPTPTSWFPCPEGASIGERLSHSNPSSSVGSSLTTSNAAGISNCYNLLGRCNQRWLLDLLDLWVVARVRRLPVRQVTEHGAGHLLHCERLAGRAQAGGRMGGVSLG